MVNRADTFRVGLLAVLVSLAAVQASALTLCSQPNCFATTLGPRLDYRIVSGELGFDGEPGEAVTGSMSIQRIIPAPSEPYSTDVDFEISDLSLLTDSLILSGSGEVDASAQGGVGLSRSLTLLGPLAVSLGNDFVIVPPNDGVIVPPHPPPDRLHLGYGFAAQLVDAPSGVDRWTSLSLSTFQGSESNWSGIDDSAPESFILDLQIFEYTWDVEGTTLTSLDSRAVGHATIELAAVPEPSTAFLIGLGLVGLGAQRRSR